MGYGPREVASMWLWEFMALVDEVSGKSGQLTADEAEEIGQMLDALPDRIT